MLEAIGERGPAAFYEGAVAEGIVKAIRGKGGVMTVDDLKSESGSGGGVARQYS